MKGVKTTANFSLDFRLMTGALDIVMESSYPVSEDLKITVTASVKIVYSGGYTRMQDYTFDVFSKPSAHGEQAMYISTCKADMTFPLFRTLWNPTLRFH